MENENLRQRLPKAVAEFVIRWVNRNTPPERTEITVRVSVTFAPLTGEATELKRQRKPTKRSAAKRPLTDEEWEVMKKIPYPRRWKKIFEYFAESDNKEASKAEMIAAGVIPDQNFEFASFNSFSKMHGSNCVLKRARISHVPEKPSTFRLFPLESKTE